MDRDHLRRRWHPRAEAELRDAYDLGLLEERNWCDLKREVESTDGARKELARDLASFGVDGGTLVIGIDEKAPGGNPLHPVKLVGLPERVERIALDRIDPPLIVSCATITSSADPGAGYLLVHVPVSPMAPHQVGGVYYGRGDKTKRALPDPEVQRLFARRAQWARGADGILRECMDADPFGEDRQNGHLFVVAQPVAGWPEMFRDLVAGPDAQIRLNEVKKLVTGNAKLSEALQLTFPNQRYDLDFSFMFPVVKTARGAMLTSRGVNMSFDVPEEAATLDAEVSEDGGVRFFHGGAVRDARVRQPEGKVTHRPQMYLVPVILFAWQCLGFVAEISRIAGYEGMWDLGVGITDTMNADGIAPLRNTMPDRVHWNEDSYQRTTRASVTELEQAPASVAGRLMGRLARAFSADKALKYLLADTRW